MDLDVVQKGLNQMEPKWLKPLMRRRNCDLQQIIRQCVKMKIKSTQTDKRTDNRSTQTDFTLIDLQARNKPFDSELIKSFLKEIITWQKEKSGGSAKAKRPNGVINQTSTPTIEPNPNSAEFIPTDNTDRCDTEPDWLASLKFIDTDGEEPLHHWIEEYFCTDEVKKLFRETDARLTECRQLLDNRKLLSPSNTKKQLDPSHMV